ncbi:hypothetical protein WG908_05890 [Sphingobium sp. AN641]|uniref:tetratricopeptide repeat protein n=1 Tax=Sphingobium sp. AN641 TaxID=3133443 RepID=UPI0030C4AB2D
MRHSSYALSACLLGAPALLAIGTPAIAQKAPVETRVDRLEKEMRAVQRKVFPAGAPMEAEITRPAAPTIAPGSPANTPVVDLMARVSALESQLATLTGATEVNSYKIKQLEEAFNRYKSETEGRLLAPDTPAARPAAAEPAAAPARPVAAPTTPAPAPTATASQARTTAVAAIERPDTGDAALDAYTYGYRLWDAKFYPEAQAQLKATVDKHGDSSVASRASNLLGRAYLDDGKPALASVAFYENYQKRPRGDRAADSLAYLGEALIQLKKPADACKVYAELEQVYGATMSSAVRGLMDKGRTRAKCS